MQEEEIHDANETSTSRDNNEATLSPDKLDEEGTAVKEQEVELDILSTPRAGCPNEMFQISSDCSNSVLMSVRWGVLEI